jgi:hypothetical protein
MRDIAFPESDLLQKRDSSMTRVPQEHLLSGRERQRTGFLAELGASQEALIF